MRIERLDLKAFGGFTDRQLDLSAGPHRFHLIVGPNESGKSTTLRAITALLYGFDHQTDDAYIHAPGNLRVGACLVDDDGERVEVVRRKGTKRTLLEPDDKTEVPESVLAAMLGGVSKESFMTRFGLSHDELVRGGQSIIDGQGDLGEILFAAGAGVGQLRAIKEHFDKAAADLFKPTGRLPAINAAISQIREQRAKVREVGITPRRYDDLRNELAGQQRLSDELGERMARLRTTIARLEAAGGALPLVPAWRAASAAVAASEGTVLLDDDFIRRRRDIDEDLRQARHELTRATEQIEQLTGRIAEHPVDEPVAAAESEIDALVGQKGAVEKEITDRDNRLRDRGRGLRHLVEGLSKLSIDVPKGDDETRMERIDAAIDRVKMSEGNRARLAELARQHPLRVDAADRAAATAESLAKQIESLGRRIEQTPALEPPVELAAAVTAAGDVAERLAGHQSLADQAAAASDRCRQILQRLPGLEPAADPVEVAGRSLPPAGAVAKTETLLTDATQKLRDGQADVARQRRAMSKLEDQRRAIDTAGRLPAESDLIDARQRRDQWVGQLDANRWEQQRDGLIGLIADADLVVDTLRQHQEKVLRIASLDQQIVDAAIAVEQAEGLATALQKGVTDAEDQWTRLWAEAGVAAGPPETMRSWPAEHRALVTAVGDAAAATERARKSQNRIEHSVGRLRDALSGNRAAESETSLAALMQLATGEVRRVGDAVAARQTLVEQHRQWSEDQTEAARAARAADEAMAQWRRNWEAIVAAVGGEGLDPAEVAERIRVVTELLGQQKETRILFNRIASMTDDQVAFTRRVARMVRSIGEDSAEIEDDDSPLAERTSAAMLSLQRAVTRLKKERAAAESRRQLTENLRAVEVQLSTARSQCGRLERSLQSLCDEAGCQSPDQLPQLERAAARRREELATLRGVEDQLRILAGGQDLAAFADGLNGVTPERLQIDAQAAASELQTVAGQYEDAHQRLGALRLEFDKIDGSAAASAAAQSLQLAAGGLQRDVRTYVRHRVAGELLQRAMDHYRGENQSPVLALAEAAMATLTGGRYVTLRPDEDDKGRTVLYAVPAEGDEVPAHRLSTGTADALYLSLRIASLRHQMDQGVTLPLIVDDCLVQLDNERSIAAMRLLSELSRRTQVVMFTHHRHLADLAEANLEAGGVHVHEMVG